MIIVDDRLALDVLAGRMALASCATTWGFHYRLTRAVFDEERHGVLSRSIRPEVRQVVADPPGERLQILDPRQVTSLAATMAIRHGLNLLGAEMVASAVYHGAELYLSAGNVGRSWPDVLAAEAVSLTVV